MHQDEPKVSIVCPHCGQKVSVVRDRLSSSVMCPECLEFISSRRTSLSVPILVVGAMLVAGVALYFVFGSRPADDAPAVRAPDPGAAAPPAPPPKPVAVPPKPEPVVPAPKVVPSPAPAAAPAAQERITYRVTGDCAQARVAYIEARGKTVAVDVKLPWVRSLGVGRSFVAYLSARPVGGKGKSLVAEILRNGKPWKLTAATGPARSATCTGTLGAD